MKKNDSISKPALMKEFSDFVRESNNSDFARTPTWNDAVSLVDSMPPSEPEQHGRIFEEIVLEYPSICVYPEYEGKPYFSIKYTENGEGFIGYGTYNPKVLSEFLKEYFMPPVQPKIIRCEDCMHNGSFDTDCPIEWNGKEYCSFAERKDDG
jgi:hypothetical protein